ncbi:MAG TPA: hypothetical protein VMO17_01470 [Terriglobia bacterium]|nr:hypothetical protein [Terriglobia bacterium]
MKSRRRMMPPHFGVRQLAAAFVFGSLLAVDCGVNAASKLAA